MKLTALSVMAVLTALAAAGYEFETDFSVADPCGASYAIDIERNTSLSHRHGSIDNGVYRISVDGNRHFLATPPLRDFRLDLDFAFVPYRRLDFTMGMKLFFRYDRRTRKGEELDVLFDKEKQLHFILNGSELAVFDGARAYDEVTADASSARLVLEVAGEKGEVSVFGHRVSFSLASHTSPIPHHPGTIGFDQTINEGSKLLLRKVSLTSPEKPVKTELEHWQVELPRSQGCAVPPRYEVTLNRYGTGERELVMALSGFLPDMPKREKCGSEWSSMSDRVESPYVKLIAADGKERKFYFWNGLKVLKTRDNGGAEMPWPCVRRYLLPEINGDFLVACGYEHVLNQPWRFAENGPYEAVMTLDGRRLYVGESLGGGGVAVSVRSPEGKKLVSRIPADLPRREDALDHAREQHYFYESEKPGFSIEAVFRRDDFSADEIELRPRLESVYGDAVDIAVLPANDQRMHDLGGGLLAKSQSFRLAKNPGTGVWHLITEYGARPRLREERTVFEVLSDSPDGPCPPLASGLPTLVSMPNEIAYLEESAFDPWGDFGGVAHYYAIDMRYPAVGEKLRTWELDHLYHRKYFTWVNRRNAKDLDMNSEWNRRIMRHADYFGGYPNGKHQEGRFDFAQMRLSGPFQRQVIDDYLRERNLGWKIEGKMPTDAEFKRLFDSGWDDFKTYAKGCVDAYMKDFVDYLLSVNPKLARASYGPFPVYAGRYKTPYTCEYDSHPIEDDPRLRTNGSFFLLEDYHYSCDYPLCRPAYFVAAYCMLHPQGRRIFPEIYYPGFSRCADGAVYQAHPDRYSPLAHTHQRRIAYQYVYGTPFIDRNGDFRYWTDYGFHARTPRVADMDEFLHAWGRSIRNRPAKPLRSPVVIVDPDAFRRFGDFFEQCGAYDMRGPGFSEVRSDVNNLAEESVGYAYEHCVAAGYTTPVVATLAALDRLDGKNCEFVILPPLAKSTPPEILGAIRRARTRGVRFLGFIEACGLEDELGCFMKDAPTMIERESFRQRYSRGREGLSTKVAAEIRSAFARLAPEPAVKTERGTVMASVTEKGDIVVVLSDDSPLYNDPAEYPVSFRFEVSSPGIGDRAIEADAPYAVVARSPDRLVIRTCTDKDTALYFCLRSRKGESHDEVSK